MQLSDTSLLAALLSRDSTADLEAPLEAFVAFTLFDAGIWPTPRTSDGLQSTRVVEWGPKRVRVCGKIWSIDQTLHVFWFDADDRTVPTSTAWALYLDVDKTSMNARLARHVLDLIQDPSDVPWLVTLTGPT